MEASMKTRKWKSYYRKNHLKIWEYEVWFLEGLAISLFFVGVYLIARLLTR